MTQTSEVISAQLDNLINRAEETSKKWWFYFLILLFCISQGMTYDEKELFFKLYTWYPRDVGCFCLFFFNMIKLKPGESLYLAPNVPHSYVKGGEYTVVCTFHVTYRDLGFLSHRPLSIYINSCRNCIHFCKTRFVAHGPTRKRRQVIVWELCCYLCLSCVNEVSDNLLYHIKIREGWREGGT